MVPAMTLKQALKALGGTSNAARQTGIPRTVLLYWQKHGAPHYRKTDVDKVIEAAKKQKEAA